MTSPRPRTPPSSAALVACAAAALTAGVAMTGCDADAPSEEPPGTCRAPAPPERATGVALERVFGHAFSDVEAASRMTLVVPSPFAPAEWYLVKQKGWILRFSEDPSAPGPEVVLDIRDARLSVDNDEAGIVSLAFHPSGRHAFIAYQSPTRTDAFFDSIISRFDVRDDGTIDADSEVELLRLPQPNFPHSVDHVAFGPDGMLYATFGDGAPGAHRVEAQNPHSLYGAMIRIDVDRSDAARGTAYAIPPDNPFADGVDGAPEVFAYGLRNTWRFSFDRDTGDIWGGDVGESSREEINRIVAGGNYGWPIMEGGRCFGAETCDEEGLIAPIATYTRDVGYSVTGGYVYRGGDVPSLRGRFVYADYMTGMIWSVSADAAPGEGEPRLELASERRFVSFAESPDGELYLVRWSQPESRDRVGPGGLYKLVAGEAPSEDATFPRRLSETGCVDAEDVTRPAPGLRPYAPASQLWSDGAAKRRFVALPEGARVGVDGDGKLDLPEGSVLVKHFLFGDVFHETRLYMHHADVGWRGYTYRWRPDQRDADLLETGVNATLADGTFWRYPSPAQCGSCHTEAAGRVLGLEVGQLGAPLPTEGRPQIEAWADEGLLSPDVDPAALEAFARFAAVDDPDATTAHRARSYLHSNCSGCHRPGGPPQTGLDLRFDTALGEMRACDTPPLNGTLGHTEPDRVRLLAPGDPDASLIARRMAHEGPGRMPPLATELVDEEAVSVVRAWIAGIEGCD